MSTKGQYLKFYIAIITVLLMLPYPGKAQDESIRIKNNAISYIPTYALLHGARFDYERRLGSGEVWLLLAPQIFMHSNDYYSYYDYYDYYWSNYSKMRGVGINAYLKGNIHKSEKINSLTKKPASAIYVAGGPIYQYFEFQSYEEVTVPVVIDGITYYKFEQQEITTPVHRVGAIFNIGLQFNMDPFFFDLYGGFGFKVSMDKNGERVSGEYTGWFDPVYTGGILDGGFKFGIYF